MSGDLVPATRNWFASEAAGSGGDLNAHFLTVSGEIELGNMNERPHLTLSDPPSSNLSVLSLDLVVNVAGDSVPQLHWAKCELRNRTFPGAYTAIKIMWQGIEVVGLKL